MRIIVVTLCLVASLAIAACSQPQKQTASVELQGARSSHAIDTLKKFGIEATYVEATDSVVVPAELKERAELVLKTYRPQPATTGESTETPDTNTTIEVTPLTELEVVRQREEQMVAKTCERITASIGGRAFVVVALQEHKVVCRETRDLSGSTSKVGSSAPPEFGRDAVNDPGRTITEKLVKNEFETTAITKRPATLTLEPNYDKSTLVVTFDPAHTETVLPKRRDWIRILSKAANIPEANIRLVPMAAQALDQPKR